MKTVRQPAVANAFYSGDIVKLKKQISSFLKNSKNTNYQSRAVIVPHAGYIYSGQLACEGINQLDKNAKNIFILAPSHKVWFDGIAISSFDEWRTPIGNIQINKKITEELIKNYGVNYNDEAHSLEHSIEVQIPIIQYYIRRCKNNSNAYLQSINRFNYQYNPKLLERQGKCIYNFF